MAPQAALSTSAGSAARAAASEPIAAAKGPGTSRPVRAKNAASSARRSARRRRRSAWAWARRAGSSGTKVGAVPKARSALEP
eukprot:15034758-Alexandrium_andersonii.AAC.1